MITLFIGGEWHGREENISLVQGFFVRVRTCPQWNILRGADEPEPSKYQTQIYELTQWCGRQLMVYKSTRAG